MDKKTTSKEELTPKQGELLKVIQTYIGKNGFPPSIREIAKLMGLSSTATVHTHLQALKAKGYIKVNSSKKRQSRAFEVTDEQSENLNKIPLVGEVAAGTGVIAEENITDYYDLPSLLTNNIDASSLFMLRVKGESMIDAGDL
jgi:repressor LexA